MKREDLFFAINETTHALRFTQSAAKRFAVDAEELEAGSTTAASVAYIDNRLSDAEVPLSAAEVEIDRLLQESGSN